MQNKRRRRRLALRAAAWCFVLALLCSCLLPVFAERTAETDDVPGLTQEDELEGELPPEELPDEPELFPADDEEADLPEEPPTLPEHPEEAGEPEEPLAPEPEEDEPAEEFETVYLFWQSERDEAEGGLPYAEQTVRSGEELLLPEEPEADGKQFRYWYTRDAEGEAVRFLLPEGPLWPEQDGEQSLYAYFTAEEADLLTDPEEPEIPALDGLAPEEEELTPGPEREKTAPETDEDATEESADEDALLAEQDAQGDTEDAADAEDLELLEAGYSERAAVFLLKTPTCLPGSNDPSQWAPDNSECRWIGRVDTRGASWSDYGRNITSNVEDYIVSWPDGSTDPVWTLEPENRYWNAVLNEIWDEYRSTIEKETGITGLEKSDLEAITVTPYKISRDNNTQPDKHIDCTISVRSQKSFTARFNVRAPGEDEYEIVDSHEYQIGQPVKKTGATIAQSIDIGGVRYVFDGWYREKSGLDVDEPGDEKVTEEEWGGEGYLPEDDELKNGVVNFYAHYTLAEVQPDTGVTLCFFAAPLLLCAGAAGFCCTKTKKEEDE